VKKLIASDNAIAIVGEIARSRSLEAAPIGQEAKIPMVSTGSTNPSVAQNAITSFVSAWSIHSMEPSWRNSRSVICT
jgi:ABC-type branched-subunit amino acid transport system substrate-binding protein